MWKDNYLIFKDEWIRFFSTEKFWIKFAFVFGLYFLSIMALIRADFFYIDDIGRFVTNRGFSVGFNRTLSERFSQILSMNLKAWDISPLSQIWAIAILSLGSMIFVYVLSNRKIGFIPLIASLAIGLNPYFLENLSYKEESMGMALSVLLPLVPFLFLGHRKLFVVISALCILGMFKTYQASSGVYVLMAIMLSFRMYLQKDVSYKGFLLSSVVGYVLGGLIFRLFFMQKVDAYVSSDLYPLNMFLEGVYSNLHTYLNFLWSDFGNGLIKYFIIISMALFLINAFQKGKIKSFFLSFVVLALMLCLSYGAYLALQRPLFQPRAFIGFGIFLAIVILFNLSSQTKKSNQALFYVNHFVSLVFIYGLITFATAYGNILKEQQKYANFRMSILMKDLADLLPNRKGFYIFFNNGVGHTPYIKIAAKNYPLIYRLVPVTGGGAWQHGYAPMLYYGMEYNEVEEGITWREFQKCTQDSKPALMLANAYHKIEKSNECYIVTFK